MNASRREPGLPYANLLAIAAGLAWMASGEGVWGFWLGAIPGSLMLAGGIASLLLPGDVRMPQLIALGGGGALVAGLPMILVVGWIHALGLVALAVATFVACGWAAQRREPPIEGVPEPALDVALAIKVGFDQLALASIIATRPGRILRDVPRLAREASEAHVLFERSGWLEKPASYHREPPPLTAPLLRLRRSLGFSFEQLSFESGYEPHPGEPGRERWLSYASNREAHAWVLRHADLGRPWLICIPGYGMGMPMIDFSAFEVRRLHRDLGLNVVCPVLPFHGPRRHSLRSGDGFLNGDVLDTIHAQAQSMWDVRRLMSWLHGSGATQVGVYGLSLGGYSTALLAGLEPGLACAIAGIPATDFSRLIARLAPHSALRELERSGLDWSVLRELLSVVSPLHLAPRVARDRLSIFGGTADHVVPADQVLDLWTHWGEPRMAWYAGSHLSFLREPGVRLLIDDTLRDSGLVLRR